MRDKKEITDMLKLYKKTKLELAARREDLCRELHLKDQMSDSLPELGVQSCVQSSNISDPTYNAALRCVGIDEERIKPIENDINDLSGKIEQVHRWLSVLRPIERKVIDEIYIKGKEGMTYVRLGQVLGYSESGVKKIRDKALKKMMKI